MPESAARRRLAFPGVEVRLGVLDEVEVRGPRVIDRYSEQLAARCEVLTRFEFVGVVPRNALGEILRNELR